MTDGPLPSVAAQRPTEPDRPWMDPAVEIHPALLDQWQQAVLAEPETGSPSGEGLRPGISVVMPSYRGEAHIGRALASLAAQTLDPALFEVIVVLNGPPDGTRAVLDRFRAEHPRVTLRVVQLAEAGASLAYNAGIAAASREYTAIIDDDDWVSPAYLKVLLDSAGPRLISMGTMIDVAPDGTRSTDNYINNVVAPHAGKRVRPLELRIGASSNAPKAVATNLIKDLTFPVGMASGMDVVFWATLVVRSNVEFYACPPEAGAAYYRSLRDESVSRQALTFDFSVRQRLDVIAELDRLLPQAFGESRELVQGRMRSQAYFIEAYLAEHPEDHGRVVEEVDRRAILNMPYWYMTRVTARGLVVAFAFAPYADTSAVVMAKRVRARGEIVDVIQNDMGRVREVDESLRVLAGPFVSRSTALQTPTHFAAWTSMEKFAVEGMKHIRRRERTHGRYSWVYSRAQFAASHFLAAAHKLHNPKVTWIAEFSDPLLRDVQDQERGSKVLPSRFVNRLRAGLRERGLPVPPGDNCFRWCEEIAYALADQLVFTNVNQFEYMMSYCSDPKLVELVRSKAVISPQPTLGPEFYQMGQRSYPLDPELVHLAYFGNFYATRGLDDVLVAVQLAPEEIRSRLRVHVFTSKPEVLAGRAEELGIADNIVAGPYVRFLEFLNMTTKFDCLIVNDAVTEGSHALNPYLPSKWSDYKGSGTPVWGLIEEGSPLSHEVLGFVSPVGDVASAGEVLAQLVQKKAGRL
ncbi:glycosyltransferase [Catellatospora sp. KI3]|uniref:glycosyltransferase n=1 Tax=Catellatospora sp. KI3 TaxID=3041620 RepID=UPI0024821294|nr:glycosyltransferase [Catellatospora sp. KI3]MDI1460071.1 glycosyltransferase [Catellatospora sp. KI3]